MFSHDPNFEDNERQYNEIKLEILGGPDSAEDDDDQMRGGDGEDAGAGDGSKAPASTQQLQQEEPYKITDMTSQDLINLRRTIYLTIMSSVDFEECAHKLMGVIKEGSGQETELCNMIVECCSQERTYLKFYGLLAERFCRINRIYQEKFDECFALTV